MSDPKVGQVSIVALPAILFEWEDTCPEQKGEHLHHRAVYYGNPMGSVCYHGGLAHSRKEALEALQAVIEKAIQENYAVLFPEPAEEATHAG